MIKSMTGFASLTHEDERATIGVTVRAVHHRFLDIQLRIPQSLAEVGPRAGAGRAPDSRAAAPPRVAGGGVERGVRERAVGGDRPGARARPGRRLVDAGR